MRRSPFHIMTKPTGPICNLDCAYCYYLDKEKLYPRGENFRMSDATLERYVEQFIASQPGPDVTFAWQGGEPTLMGLDFFRRAVELERRYLPAGFTCHNAIQTNGTLLDAEWCRFLKDNDFLVGISIDGPADLHDVYRRNKGGRPTHDAVMRGLRLLQEFHVDYNVLCVVNAVNGRRPLDVYEFLTGAGVTWIQFIPLVERVGDGVSPRTVPAETYGRFLADIFDVWVRRDVGRVFVQIFEECVQVWAGQTANLCIFRPTCGDALALEHDGALYACDHFVDPRYRLGNIRDSSLVELVDSPAQVAFGQAKRTTLPRYCLECDVRFMCNGACPKDRFIRTPDGEPGLNYLCAGYKHFFHHVDPAMRQIVALLRAGRFADEIMSAGGRSAPALARGGRARNQPCPCGSGRKYKRCCGAER